MQTKGYDLAEVLGIELPTWSLLAATGIVGLLILRIALKPKALASTSSAGAQRSNPLR